MLDQIGQHSHLRQLKHIKALRVIQACVHKMPYLLRLTHSQVSYKISMEGPLVNLELVCTKAEL